MASIKKGRGVLMDEMTSRERMLAAYAHKGVDRVPCSPRNWAWAMDYYGQCAPQTGVRRAERRADGIPA